MEEKYRYLPEFDEALKSARPLCPLVAERLAELLRVCSALAGHAYRQQKFSEHQVARSEVDHLLLQKAEREGTLAIAQAALADMADGACILGIVFLIAFAACFGAEFVFNWAILPWLLGVPPHTLLGIALAVAPATAPVILDRILARVLGVGDAVSAMVAAAGVSARVRSVARVGFLIAAGVATLYSVWVLAEARAVASALMTNESAIGPAPAQQHALDLSLLLVSMVLTVNGALFYLFGAHEVKLAVARRKARAEVNRLRVQLDETGVAIAKAQPTLAAARHAWERIDELEKSVVESFVAEGEVKLAQAVSQPGSVLTASERVRQMLNRLHPDAAAA